MRATIAILFAASLTLGAGDTGEWPSIAKGVWDITIKPQTTNHQEKTTKISRELCNNPSLWFSRYPGKTPLGKDGCRFSSHALDGKTYEIKSECALLKGGVGVARGVVNLESAHAFESDWEVTEGNKAAYREHVRGIWSKSCDKLQ